MSTSPGLWKAWLLAARPQTLFVSICPVLIAIVLSFRLASIDWFGSVCCLMIALLLQLAANFSNDYFDAKHGVDTPQRVGPKRATAEGWISASSMKRGFILCLLAAFLLGLIIILKAGWLFAILGVAAILSAILYTGGPFPYGYFGLGDVFAFFFFGPVAVCGTYYVNALVWSDYVFILSVAPGLLATAILAVNNLRDCDEDTLHNKRTLAVLLGKRFVKFEYAVCVWVAALIPLYLYFHHGLYPFTVLTIIVTFLAKKPLRMMWDSDDADLNEALVRTAKLLVSFSILFTVGVLAN
ncbi:MAG: 1,4-dihydroxy-2-naphthoate polyprenyltransferase [bacterium]